LPGIAAAYPEASKQRQGILWPHDGMVVINLAVRDNRG
jgi:hypothetical protein